MATMNAMGVPESRNGSFSAGAHGGDVVGAGMHLPTTLQQNVPTMFHPSAILAMPDFTPTGNGMSTSDHQRQLVGGGMLPTSNGMSRSSYVKGRSLMSGVLNV